MKEFSADQVRTYIDEGRSDIRAEYWRHASIIRFVKTSRAGDVQVDVDLKAIVDMVRDILGAKELGLEDNDG